MIFLKSKSLIGGSLLQTVLILAGNQTQVTFSGITPLDHQDFCRYCQYSSNEQKPDCLYHMYAGVEPGNFQRREGFMNQGFSINISSKFKEKKPCRGNVLSFFSKIPLKQILNSKFDLKTDKIKTFFPKSGHFDFLKGEGRSSLLPSICTPGIKDFHCRIMEY